MHVTWWWLTLNALAAAGHVATKHPPQPTPIGSIKQLLVDGTLFESILVGNRSSGTVPADSNALFEMHTPVRARGSTSEPLLSPDATWELALGNPRLELYASVLWDDELGLWRVWYDTMGPQPIPDDYSHMQYAEISADLLSVTKPLLHQVEVHGSTANNLLAFPQLQRCCFSSNCGARGCHNYTREGFSVWRDPNRTFGGQFLSQASADGLVTSVSEDGIHWADVEMHYTPNTTINHTTWKYGAADTQTIVFWDTPRQCYSLYTRCRSCKPSSSSRSGFMDTTDPTRGVRRLSSNNLTVWTDETPVLYPDEVDRHVHLVTPMPGLEGELPLGYYGAMVFLYHGVYFMFPQRFWHWTGFMYPSGEPAKGEQGPAMMDVGLAYSRDGQNFTHVGGREAFIRTGPRGSWYSREVWMLPNPAIHPPTGDLFLFFAGSNENHNGQVDPNGGNGNEKTQASSGIDAMRMRADGFISLTAPLLLEGGIIATTHPVTFTGSVLYLNLDTSAGGAAWVAIVDADTGVELPGYSLSECVPMVVNDIAAPVLWRPNASPTSSVAPLQGRAVKLRFHLVGARLYSFQFLEPQRP